MRDILRANRGAALLVGSIDWIVCYFFIVLSLVLSTA